METITNVAAAAKNVIWGEQNTATTQGNGTAGQEPISGVSGKGTVEEPYDQGNAEEPTSTSTTTTKTNIDSNTDINKTASESNTSDTYTSEPSTDRSTMSETTSAPNNPINASSGGSSDPLQTTDKTGVVAGNAGNARIAEDIVPSESAENPGAAPSSGAAPSFKQQGADKPEATPSSKHGDEELEDPQKEAERLMKKRDPNDHSGEPMHMHDGNETKSSIPATQEERRESKVGMPGGQEHGKEPKGTGEQYIKSSGLAADGGNFDVSNPGAGREADRLMEEKGIKKTSSGPSAVSDDTSTKSPEAGKEKVSMSQKIKDKLHIGHKDK